MDNTKSVAINDVNMLVEDENNLSGGSKDSEENVDAIKKFIEDQTKEIELKKAEDDEMKSKSNCEAEMKIVEGQNAGMSVGSSVMEMIFSESEAKLVEKKVDTDVANDNLSAIEKLNSSMSLSVGSKVEAKDFREDWHVAEIVEVDYDEMEVLLRYDLDMKKHDEWVSVSSPRLRPVGSEPAKPAPEEVSIKPKTIKEEEKEEVIDKGDEKGKVFGVGERCLARWRDNRRFMATIKSDLGNGNYEVIFDDGFLWKCTKTRLYKWKPGKNESLTIDTSLNSPSTSTPSPILTGGPSNSQTPVQPAYHTHLFDPARDYLPSKSERREMKRKLNIKEIFNIGQKRPKAQNVDRSKPKEAVARKPRIIRRTSKPKTVVSVNKEQAQKKDNVPVAVASIIGTINNDSVEEPVSEGKILPEIKKVDANDTSIKKSDNAEVPVDDATNVKEMQHSEANSESSPVKEEEEFKLEKFEQLDDKTHVQVIDRMKEVINKLEDGLKNEIANSPKPEIKEIKEDIPPQPVPEVVKEEVNIIDPVDDKIIQPDTSDQPEIKTEQKKLSKMKKGKKLRLLQEKKVKKQVEKVKNELEEMKRQVEEMRQQMLLKSEQFSKGYVEMPDSFLLPGEWCCKWANGQPVGTVSEIEADSKFDVDGKPALPRRSVQVEDKRLPPGWTKHMVRRSYGNSAGKWDVVLVSPDNHRFHTKTDIRAYLENNPNPALQPYEHALTDFGVHMKLSRRMGWISNTPGGEPDGPIGTLSSTSPLVKKKKLSLKKPRLKFSEKKRKLTLKVKLPRLNLSDLPKVENNPEPHIMNTSVEAAPITEPPLEDGYVYVGSLKVQIIENLLRCPAEGCFKNFRNNTLLQMHIKHYHRELRKMLGATPKVLDLAYARTAPIETEPPRHADTKVLKVKILKPPKRDENKEGRRVEKEIKQDMHIVVRPTTPIAPEDVVKQQDSPKLRDALVKPVKRPKVLLPVRRLDPGPSVEEDIETEDTLSADTSLVELDFEAAISTHTVTKPFNLKKKDKKRKSFGVLSVKQSEDEDWYGTSDVDTQSSFPRSGSPDSKVMDGKPLHHVLPDAVVESKPRDTDSYIYNEYGERIKLVHMKREEIINCHCGFREEDGLMVQCELCLCWQHALCHNIHNETQVPEKYTCSICLNPRRGRRSKRFLHDQDRLYEGLLPGGKPCDSLRRSHELSGNLLRIQDALHAMRVKGYVASKKNHPKLYLWAEDWEQADISYTQEKLNSDYSDLNVMINSVGKENMPVPAEDVRLDIRSDDQDPERYLQRQLQPSLGGLMASPGGTLDLPISTSELERLAKCVQEQESVNHVVSAPQPEAAIENSACRDRLLKHLQRCHALIDARLDSIEAQVAELESQDPSFEDDETADYFPRTKQTIQMLMRDLDTMEELGVVT